MSGNQAGLILPPQLTVENVEAVKELILNRLHEGGAEPECYAGDVKVIDAAGLQLLLALYKSAVREGKQVTIINPSPYLRKVFSCSGADKVLAIKEVG